MIASPSKVKEDIELLSSIPIEDIDFNGILRMRMKRRRGKAFTVYVSERTLR